MKITFLGTSAMLPTKERNPSSILIEYKSDGLLIDCGEGTQKQIRMAGIKPTKITKLLITHFNGDHILGIPGLMQSLVANNYEGVLEVYGPEKTAYYLKNLLKGFIAKGIVKIKVYELKDNKKFFENKDFTLSCKKVKHDIPCLAYSFKEKDTLKVNIEYTKKFGLTQHPLLGDLQRGKSIKYEGKKIDVKKATIKKPGRKISIVLDTLPELSIAKFVENSDVLICDSTWDERSKNKKGFHMTNLDAAKMAKKSKSKKLILTHFSQRYKTADELVKEAKKIFKETHEAKDFAIFNV